MNAVISELLVVMVLGEMALGETTLGETALGETALGEIAVRHNCWPPNKRDKYADMEFLDTVHMCIESIRSQRAVIIGE